MTSTQNRGSLWRRWDPHLHTPATLLANRYEGRWDAYLDAIEKASPRAEALGITEYCVITGYKQFREYQRKGRALGVMAFPNVEFRFDIQTEKKRGINLHLLFSPDDSSHVQEIEGALASLKFEYAGTPYKCMESDLVRLGRAFDPRQTDERGALCLGVEQFRLSLEQLRALFRDHAWVRKNCLVAIDAGEADGTSGLKKDGGFAALRRELESFADVVFSSQDSDREYWLGRKEGHGPEFIEDTYRCLKPCLHGSDAHRLDDVLRPKNDRYCWIRADATFTGLKQALLEPGLRVCIAPEPPPGPSDSECITAVEAKAASWLLTPNVELNDGLVAIIGPKGSGKTALADLLAHGAGMHVVDEASFLVKAHELLADEEVAVRWANGAVEQRRLAEQPSDDETAHVRYLSQQFVERLCSAQGMTSELVREIESVVFQAIPEDGRFNATSFDELRALRLYEVHRHRESCLERIQELTLSIAQEEEMKAKLPKLEDRQKGYIDKRNNAVAELKKLLPKDKHQELKQLDALHAALEIKEKNIQEIRVKRERLRTLAEEFPRTIAKWQRDATQLRELYKDTGLADDDWRSFVPTLPGTWASLIERRTREAELAERVLLEGASGSAMDETNPTNWPLKHLREKIKALTTTIGVEKDRAKKHAELQRQQLSIKREFDALEKVIAHAKGADARRAISLEQRRGEYAQIFDTYAQEEAVLEDLYSPLRAQLNGSEATQRRLAFYVRRNIDLEVWVKRGEDLLDLRKTGNLRLEDAAKQLVQAWRGGNAASVGSAMESFINGHARTIVAAKRTTTTAQDIGRWLFSTAHVSLRYGVRYDGVDLSKLSPGTRGVVLLMLYLAIDQWDHRPLIVDQPEENLDPQSVYDDLVRYFRAAKRRRQVILVTHNPNLVVNTDADQVIVANSERTGPGLPRISYLSGGLEDDVIRKSVCRVLEGGERAFRERERRYDLPRDPRTARK